MASSLFGTNNPNSSPVSNNQPNNMMQMLQKFGEFKRVMSGKNPQSIVQNLINSGRMSQSQYQQLSSMAQQFQSMLK